MLWVKGVNEFVIAAKLLLDDGIICRFALVGDKDENNPSSVSEQTLLSWEKDEHIEWWGHHKDMISVLGKADIVCLPTYREGLPKSLLEAASAAIPIVTTNVPGCREVVEDGNVENPIAQISISEALKIEDDYEVGEELSEQVSFDSEFGRRQVLSIRQHLISRIHEQHRDTLIKRYKRVCFNQSKP